MTSVFGSILRQRTQDWIFAGLEPHRTPTMVTPAMIEPGDGYVSVFLRSARIVNVRSGLRRVYGVVHSTVRVPHRSGGDAEFAVVVVPAMLKELDADRLDRVVQLNHRLMGPVPYVGGDVRLEVGLLSVAATDLAAPYLQLLKALSQKAGVSYIALALPLAGLIVEGVNLLAGSSGPSLVEIGFTVHQERPRTGWYAAIRARKDMLDINTLRVDPHDYRLLHDNGSPLADYPYLVVEMTQARARDDWFKVPELAQAYGSVQEEFRRGSVTGTEEAIAAFRRIALTNNDLLSVDAERLVAKVQDRYAELGPPVPPHRRRRSRQYMFPDFRSLDLFGGA